MNLPVPASCCLLYVLITLQFKAQRDSLPLPALETDEVMQPGEEEEEETFLFVQLDGLAFGTWPGREDSISLPHLMTGSGMGPGRMN